MSDTNKNTAEDLEFYWLNESETEFEVGADMGEGLWVRCECRMGEWRMWVMPDTEPAGRTEEEAIESAKQLWRDWMKRVDENEKADEKKRKGLRVANTAAFDLNALKRLRADVARERDNEREDGFGQREELDLRLAALDTAIQALWALGH